MRIGEVKTMRHSGPEDFQQQGGAGGAQTSVGLTIAERFQTNGMLTLEEFSAWAGICRRRVYGEIKDGRLRIVKIGRRTAIRAHDARRWQDALSPEAA